MEQEQGDQRGKQVVLRLLLALVDEFTYTKSNSLGLTWEYHHKCLQSFQVGISNKYVTNITLHEQKVELRKIFVIAVGLFRRLLASPTLFSSPAELTLLKDSLNLIVEVLSWKFEEPDIEKLR